MANTVKKVNTVAIADIKNINTITDSNLKKLNTLEFTGTPADVHTFIADNSSDTTNLTLLSAAVLDRPMTCTFSTSLTSTLQAITSVLLFK